MKDNILILILAASLILNFILWRGRTPESVVIEGKTLIVERPAGTDTTSRPAPAKAKKNTAAEIRTIVQRSDSTRAVIDSLPPQQRDSAIAEREGPFQITIGDSLTTNFVTIFPQEPPVRRARIDSTQYKPIKWEIPYQDTTAIYKSDIGIRTYTITVASAVVGGTIAGPVGAGVGAIAGLLIDELL